MRCFARVVHTAAASGARLTRGVTFGAGGVLASRMQRGVTTSKTRSPRNAPCKRLDACRVRPVRRPAHQSPGSQPGSVVSVNGPARQFPRQSLRPTPIVQPKCLRGMRRTACAMP